jgi:3-methyladenine DNA glycosylase AlkC
MPVVQCDVRSERRGARTPTDVPSTVLRQLEAGGVESANHMEQIAVDMGNLLASIFPGLADRSEELRRPRFLDRMRAGSRIVWEAFGERLFDEAPHWKSDTARGWAAFAVGVPVGLSIPERLELIRPFADDHHFAVREWAWLGMRPAIAEDPRKTLVELVPFVESDSAKLRRFASESTRPCGVWSIHIPLLKTQPWHAIGLLDSLASDMSRYVQDSVSNWLNDASRTQPVWVREVCERWLREHGAAVARVCRRAVRSI